MHIKVSHFKVNLIDLPSNCFFWYYNVLSALCSLKNNSSNRPDGISTSLLYNCRYLISYPICIIFKHSLNERIIFPLVWKTCLINPILKSGEPSDISNYRPISILLHLLKLFESPSREALIISLTTSLSNTVIK